MLIVSVMPMIPGYGDTCKAWVCLHQFEILSSPIVPWILSVFTVLATEIKLQLLIQTNHTTEGQLAPIKPKIVPQSWPILDLSQWFMSSVDAAKLCEESTRPQTERALSRSAQQWRCCLCPQPTSSSSAPSHFIPISRTLFYSWKLSI